MNNDRYLRHSIIDWFSQERVQQSHFAIVGCGATGNEVAKNLALLGVGKLDLYDFDTIEIHNLTRSVLFRESDIGKNKVDVAEQKVLELDPNLKARSYHGDFWELMDFEKLRQYDAVISCVDNYEARIRINQLCLLAGTNFINTGIDSKYSQIEVFPFQFSAEKQEACFECNLPASSYERIKQRYSCGWLKKISYIEKKIPSTIITSSITGALTASKAMELIRGDNRSYKAERILIDTHTGYSTISKIEKSDFCPGCSGINKKIKLIRVKPKIDQKLFISYKSDLVVTLSDPVIVSYKCVDCINEPSAAKVIFERAEDYDSSITTCQICNIESVDVTIKDSFTINELLDNYSNKKIPSKYIKIEIDNKIIIFEMEHKHG